MVPIVKHESSWQREGFIREKEQALEHDYMKGLTLTQPEKDKWVDVPSLHWPVALFLFSHLAFLEPDLNAGPCLIFSQEETKVHCH